MNLILPKEKRVVIYSVVDGEIINSNQRKTAKKQTFPDQDSILAVKNSYLDQLTEKENLFLFIYAMLDGKIEFETNVSKPKYPFHTDYNSEN